MMLPPVATPGGAASSCVLMAGQERQDLRCDDNRPQHNSQIVSAWYQRDPSGTLGQGKCDVTLVTVSPTRHQAAAAPVATPCT